MRSMIWSAVLVHLKGLERHQGQARDPESPPRPNIPTSVTATVPMCSGRLPISPSPRTLPEGHAGQGLSQASARLDFLHLDGVDHFLKEDIAKDQLPRAAPTRMRRPTSLSGMAGRQVAGKC